jgi:hypothetical protein
MNIPKIIIGLILCTIGQIFSFMQLQASVKFGWDKRYMYLLLLVSVPISWIYIKSVNYFINGFDGLIWPSRILGFGVGIIVFTTMSYFIFKEPFTLKNGLSLLLAFVIILVQLYMK